MLPAFLFKIFRRVEHAFKQSVLHENSETGQREKKGNKRRAGEDQANFPIQRIRNIRFEGKSIFEDEERTT